MTLPSIARRLPSATSWATRSTATRCRRPQAARARSPPWSTLATPAPATSAPCSWPPTPTPPRTRMSRRSPPTTRLFSSPTPRHLWSGGRRPQKSPPPRPTSRLACPGGSQSFRTRSSEPLDFLSYVGCDGRRAYGQLDRRCTGPASCYVGTGMDPQSRSTFHAEALRTFPGIALRRLHRRRAPRHQHPSHRLTDHQLRRPERTARVMGLAIGVDIGGTKVAAGVVDPDGHILARLRRDTPAQDPDKVEDVIAECIRELAADYEVEAAGLGAAGFVDAARSTVLFAPNLAWRNQPLRAAVEQRTGLPVVVENDANAAAWAETRFGAGHGQPFTVTLTVGTGLGGGVVLGGELVRGAFGAAAEVGHMNLVPDGRPCGCGNAGCWEQYVISGALATEARQRAAQSPEDAAQLLKLGDGQPASITGPMVTLGAVAGDPVALESFRAVGAWLGHGLADLAAILDPRVFIIGGGVSEAGELLASPAREAFQAKLTARGHRPVATIRVAQLGQDAGLIGAADLARI